MFQPYRLSALRTPGRDVIPKSVTAALWVATWGFGIGACTWLIARGVALLYPSHRDYVASIFGSTLDAAMVLAAALCAWRPLPGTRSHVFARLALVAWLVALVSERWPSHTVVHYDPCGNVLDQVREPWGLLLASSSGRLLSIVALSGVVLAVGRRFALPRWPAVVAAGLGATLTEVGFDEVLRRYQPGYSATRLVYVCGLPELFMVVAFAAGFGMAAFAVRQRLFLDEDAVLSMTPEGSASAESDARAFDYWRACIDAVLACTFAIASRVGEELSFIPEVEGMPSGQSVGCALGLLGFLVLVERARRRHAETSSFGLTIGAGFAALCGTASVLAVLGRRTLVLREVGMVTTAITLGGIALLLPNVSIVAKSGTMVKRALALGAFLLLLSACAELNPAGGCRTASETTEPWMSGGRLLLCAAFFFVTLAVHRASRIERAALITEARSRAGRDYIDSSKTLIE